MSISTQITVAATAETIIVTAPGALRGPMGDVTPEVTALVVRAELGASQAATSAGQASSSAAQAGDSAAEAASSAGSATGSAAAASSDAVSAEASKVAAGLSESAAEQSATEAAASASAAGRFIMVSSVAPTERTNNTPLQVADEWQDTVNNLRMSWTGSAWVALNSSAQQLEARLTDPNNPANGIGLIPASRYDMAVALANGMQRTISALPRTLWQLSPLVTNRPTPNDPSTWDWLPALQAMADAGGSWYIPDNNGAKAIYQTSRHIQVRFSRSLSIFGPVGKRPFVRIKPMAGFPDRNLIQQWSDSWYAAGETNPDERPADLTAYSGLIDRYLNIKDIELYVDSDSGGEITCLDLVSLQETSNLDGILFNGSTTSVKGWPIRIRSGGGAEVSMNGTAISNIVVYRGGWRGELKAIGSGSDIRVNGWVTSNTAHTESPFQIGIIGTVIRDLHCEAYSVGNPTFDITGSDVRIDVSPEFVIRDGQGDVVHVRDPAGTGSGKFGVSITGLRLYPQGGVSSNITNLSSINLYNDVSQPGAPITIPLAIDGFVPGLVVTASRAGATLIGPQGKPRVYDFTLGPKSKYIEYIPAGGNTGTAVVAGGTVVIADDSLKSGMVDINWSAGSVTGAVGADYFNNPQSGRITLFSSRNASETRRKARLYTDGGPAIFSNPVWDATAGTLTLTVLISFTNAKLAIQYV